VVGKGVGPEDPVYGGSGHGQVDGQRVARGQVVGAHLLPRQSFTEQVLRFFGERQERPETLVLVGLRQRRAAVGVLDVLEREGPAVSVPIVFEGQDQARLVPDVGCVVAGWAPVEQEQVQLATEAVLQKIGQLAPEDVAALVLPPAEVMVGEDQHRDRGGVHGRLNLHIPVAPGGDLGVIPEAIAKPGPGQQLALDLFKDRRVIARIAQEDPISVRRRHGPSGPLSIP